MKVINNGEKNLISANKKAIRSDCPLKKSY
ncbi:hypothetical protein J2T02_000670 [Chitinophaga terrae (ex Kim and Jung 2007)]|nr:hypothetical protein [Chitinophaga terrae (ex Kim and Jung 2007)]